MTNKPFFTIITCTRNSEQYLPQCLDSLGCQDFKDFEHIVIDGDSSDKTLSLIPSSSQVYSLGPSGISAAMNEGIKHATGEYVYFLHSDDILHNSHVLSDVAGYLNSHPSIDWVYGQIQVIDADNHKVGIFPKHKVFQLASSYLLKFFNFIPHQATFVKKSVFEKFSNFDTSLKTCMDYDLWLKISKVSNWSYLPILVANYRIHDGAQSSSKSNALSNITELETVQKRYLNHFELVISRLFNYAIAKLNKTTR